MKEPRGTKVTWGAKPPKTETPGRVCDRDGCNTRLSMYNPDSQCATHQPPLFGTVRPDGTVKRDARRASPRSQAS